MSALSSSAQFATSTNDFLSYVIEKPDDTILTDDEVYNLKGGDSIFGLKLLAGVTTGLAVLALCGEFQSLKKLSGVKGVNFIYANLACLGSMALVQYYYLKSSGNYGRYRAHQLASYHRFVLNLSDYNANRKAPKKH